jgi:prevent-host-death family protein
MQDQISIAEAKNKLPAIIHHVEKGPNIQLTRRGKPVAVLLSINEFKRLSQKSTDFMEALLIFREGIKMHDTDITDADFEDLRDTDAGRKVEL